MTVDASTIQSDVHDGFNADAADGVDAFLSNLIGEDPAKKQQASTETQDEATETTQTETGEATEENTQESPETTTEADPDDAEIEIKVGEETKKATLKDLKRLYGQEASLTQKSQKVAEAQRIADANNTRATTALNTLLGKAVERFKPYQDMDWLVLSQRMNTEDFQALRADATAAQADLTFLQTELDQTVQKQRNDTLQAHQQAAQECLKALSDPEKGIKDFSQPVYNEIVKFAADNGLPAAVNFVDPAALKIIHMAMQYAKSQQAAATAATKVNRAVQQATRVLKPTTSSSSTTQASNTRQQAMRSLRSSGSVEDAERAFMASFQKDD
jgi:hypothetical protein